MTGTVPKSPRNNTNSLLSQPRPNVPCTRYQTPSGARPTTASSVPPGTVATTPKPAAGPLRILRLPVLIITRLPVTGGIPDGTPEPSVAVPVPKLTGVLTLAVITGVPVAVKTPGICSQRDTISSERLATADASTNPAVPSNIW